MSGMLPGEAIAEARVEQLIAESASIQEFIAEYIDGGQTGVERFKQILHSVGYAMLADGIQRIGNAQESMTVEHKSALLNKEVDLFLQGASALSEEIRDR